MLGVDVVGVERLRVALERSPGLEARLFTEQERSYCRGHRDRAVSFAGTLAAKEAVIKACRLGPLAAWARRIEIERAPSGVPYARISLEGAQQEVEVSISHDAGIAVAIAMRL